MSKIGKLPISVPNGVTVEINSKNVKVVGPKGNLSLVLPATIDAKLEDGELLVIRNSQEDQAMAMHGTFRSHLSNFVKGVTEGWSKTLEMVGTGYRAEVSGRDLVLAVGFSHPVKINAPEGIDFKVEKTDITVSGTDKELVGLICARIRAVRPPEPYKGKGIKYKGEIIRRKAGKAAKAGA